MQQAKSIIDEKYPLENQFFTVQENETVSLLIKDGHQNHKKYYQYYIYQHQLIQTVLYKKFPYPKESFQVAQIIKQAPAINLSSIKYEIINQIGDRVPITKIQKLDETKEIDKIPTGFYEFKQSKKAFTDLNMYKTFNIPSQIRTYAQDLSEIFHQFANAGLYPDANPNLSNIVVYIDFNQPIFVYIPTYYCQSLFFSSKNCSALEDFVQCSRLYRKQQYAVMTSHFLNCLVQYIIQKPIEDIMDEDESTKSLPDDEEQQYFKTTISNIKKQLEKNFNTSQKMLQNSKKIENIDSLYESLNNQKLIILLSTADELRYLPVFKKGKKQKALENLFLNVLTSIELEDFRKILKTFLTAEQFWVDKVAQQIVTISNESYPSENQINGLKQLKEEFLKKLSNIEDNTKIENHRYLVFQVFLTFEKYLKNLIGKDVKNKDQVVIHQKELKTGFLKNFDSVKKSQLKYEQFRNQTREFIYPLEYRCLEYIRDSEKDRSEAFVSYLLKKTKLNLSVALLKDDSKGQVLNFEIISNNVSGDKKYDIVHQIEFLEQKQCLVVKTTVPDILLNIENGDDLIFMMNIMSRYNETVNLHVNEQRKLIVQQSISIGSPIQMIQQLFETMDIHFIFCFFISDFYKTIIEQGRSSKEIQFVQLILEIQHYVDYYTTLASEFWKELMKNDQDSYLF